VILTNPPFGGKEEDGTAYWRWRLG
jgi:hypothetical protein